jgi:hypothetical protein
MRVGFVCGAEPTSLKAEASHLFVWGLVLWGTRLEKRMMMFGFLGAMLCVLLFWALL